jgi:cellulose synthase/poly-beta-1,6-N-acetylglucosamine synthase-like glycosyltransferase
VRDNIDRIVLTALMVILCVAGTALASAFGLLSSLSRAAIYVLANFVLLFDMIDLIVRVWMMKVNGASAEGPSIDLGLAEISNAERSMMLDSYAIVASVHNAADDIDRFLTTLAPFKDVVWLVDDASDDTTLLRLRRGGWNCLPGIVNRKKPGALKHLLLALPADVQTIVVMDPDVRLRAPDGNVRALLERVIGDLQRGGAAALTPRVRARPDGWLAECQAFEYELSCGLGRKSLGDLACNSGVSVYHRRALEGTLNRHSLSVYAEDLENSLLLLASGKRIYYDDRLVLETDAKRTWRGLFSQRVGWAFGCAKLFAERMPLFARIARRSPMAAYQYVFYLGINGVALFPLKLASLCLLAMSFLKSLDDLLMTHVMPLHAWNQPALFALWYGKSALVLIVACITVVPHGERRRHAATLPSYPFYALLQYLPTAIGYGNVLALKAFGRRLYDDHYDGNPKLAPMASHLVAEETP